MHLSFSFLLAMGTNYKIRSTPSGRGGIRTRDYRLRRPVPYPG
jgi:hypothetical protein